MNVTQHTIVNLLTIVRDIFNSFFLQLNCKVSSLNLVKDNIIPKGKKVGPTWKEDGYRLYVNTTSLRKGLAHQRIASISWSGALPPRNTRLYFIWQDNPRSPKRVKRRDNKRKGSQKGFLCK